MHAEDLEVGRRRLRNNLLGRNEHFDFRFQRLFEANLIGLLIADEDRIIEANDAFLAIVGYERDELETGKLSWRAMTPPAYQSLNERAVADLKLRGESSPFEKQYLRKDGRAAVIQASDRPLAPSMTEAVC